MKTIFTIIALLICMVGNAQMNRMYVTSEKDTFIYVQKSKNALIAMGYLPLKNGAIDDKPQFVADLLEYRKECQKDSIAVVIVKGFYNPIIDAWIEPIIDYEYPSPTFEGFIEFVTKKYSNGTNP